MYNPQHFREERLPVLHQAIRSAGLASLVTMGRDGLEASHVPVWLDAERGPYGTISGHLARANPQWSRFDPAVPALLMIQGVDAYVSPSWYPSKAMTGKAVPTWNYVAVHASGPLEVFDDPERLRGLLGRLTERREAGRAEPWALADAPEDYLQGMLRGVVGFSLRISRLEGKWKLSQNRSAEDRAGVVLGLEQEAPAVAAAMRGEEP
jgi:transcriptional regulator